MDFKRKRYHRARYMNEEDSRSRVNIWEIDENDFEEDDSDRMGDRDRLELGVTRKGKKVLFRQDLDEYCDQARCTPEEVIGGQVEANFADEEDPLTEDEFYALCKEVGGIVYYIEYENRNGRKLSDGEYLGIDGNFISVMGGEYDGDKPVTMQQMLKTVIEDNYVSSYSR